MKRDDLEAAAIALLASFAIGSVMMLVVGASPAHVWWEMATGTFGDPYEIGQVVFKATGTALAGLGVALALDAGLFNIGGEGQLTAGVVACSVVGTALPAGTPAIIALPICIVAAAAAGAFVGGLIGALRVYRGAHEVITSIMLNAIVGGVALWLGTETLFVGGTTTGPAIAPGAEMPDLPFAGSAANATTIFALAIAAAVWWMRARSTWGQALRTVGRDPAAAKSVGMSVDRIRLYAMLGSGALAGMAAVNFVLGYKHAFEEGLGRGTGFLAISAALLGRMHPVGVVAASVLLGFLSEGGLVVADIVPKEVTEVLQGVVVLAIAAAVPWVRRRRARP
jgi:simple sugar transport system permease protein